MKDRLDRKNAIQNAIQNDIQNAIQNDIQNEQPEGTTRMTGTQYKELQLRRGTETENSTFTGKMAEPVFVTTDNSIRIHDGETPGGYKCVMHHELASLLLDMVYPVGSRYISSRNVSPADFLGGEWYKITSGRVMVSANDEYEAGTTGGASGVSYTPSGTVGETVLSVDQIPSHNHGASTDIQGSHSHIPNWGNGFQAYINGVWKHVHAIGKTSNGDPFTLGSSNPDQVGLAITTNDAGSHAHNITVNETGGSGSHDHGFTGTESLISTMMPYEVVHIWERTA